MQFTVSAAEFSARSNCAIRDFSRTIPYLFVLSCNPSLGTQLKGSGLAHNDLFISTEALQGLLSLLFKIDLCTNNTESMQMIFGSHF